MKRTPDESLDNIARFFESVASAVDVNGGIFFDDDLLPGEKRAIVRACRLIAHTHRQEADGVRAEAPQ